MFLIKKHPIIQYQKHTKSKIIYKQKAAATKKSVVLKYNNIKHTLGFF
jgi:hypothetical protein